MLWFESIGSSRGGMRGRKELTGFRSGRGWVPRGYEVGGSNHAVIKAGVA